jgi:hypothetical protein
MEKGTCTLTMTSPPKVDIDGLDIHGRRYGSGYGMRVGRRRMKV